MCVCAQLGVQMRKRSQEIRTHVFIECWKWGENDIRSQIEHKSYTLTLHSLAKTVFCNETRPPNNGQRLILFALHFGITIFGDTQWENEPNILPFFSKFLSWKVKINKKKCRFFWLLMEDNCFSFRIDCTELSLFAWNWVMSSGSLVYGTPKKCQIIAFSS